MTQYALITDVIANAQASIQVRKQLDFQLSSNMPRFWFGDDPIKTRLIDAVVVTFPIGERYFIRSIKQFRNQISSHELQMKVDGFIQQEAQHALAHDLMNHHLRQQDIPIDDMLQQLQQNSDAMSRYLSPAYNLSITAATEHLTALMVDCLFGYKETMATASPHVRAMLAWHAIEEMEHRDVAFDVMQQVAKVSYSVRVLALLQVSLMLMFFTIQRTQMMLRADGFNRKQRVKLLLQGWKVAFGQNGILTPMKKPYLAWFKPKFHPSHHPVISQYQVWLDTLDRTGDPIQAGEAFWAAGHMSKNP